MNFLKEKFRSRERIKAAFKGAALTGLLLSPEAHSAAVSSKSIPEKQREMTAVLKSLGGKALFGEVTIGGVKFKDAYPATAKDAMADPNMPNLKEPAMWGRAPEWEVRYWLKGACGRRRLLIGLLVDNPDVIKAFTADGGVLTENLEGGIKALPQWVQEACKIPTS